MTANMTIDKQILNQLAPGTPMPKSVYRLNGLPNREATKARGSGRRLGMNLSSTSRRTVSSSLTAGPAVSQTGPTKSPI
jgi:hypothetical protein